MVTPCESHLQFRFARKFFSSVQMEVWMKAWGIGFPAASMTRICICPFVGNCGSLNASGGAAADAGTGASGDFAGIRGLTFRSSRLRVWTAELFVAGLSTAPN